MFIENCVAKNNIEHLKRHLFKTPAISGGEKNAMHILQKFSARQTIS